MLPHICVKRTFGLIVVSLLLSALATAAPGAESARRSPGELPLIKELPDPFLFNDGSRVKTADDWARRRQEIKALVLAYEYGHMPPAPGNVVGKELSSKFSETLNATEKVVMLSMGPEGRITCRVELTVPPGPGPFPVILKGDLCWKKVAEPIIRQVVGRGYILAEFDRTEFAPDNKDRDKGVYPVYPQYDSSALSAWAWGYHRVVDFLVTQKYVDVQRIAITGHSRGGKATLLAGATDERIALTAPNNSGCGGAGCYRFQAEKSEDIAAILKNFPFWFQPQFKEFIGQIDRLPIDQHSVKALVAPRALLSTEALGDLWANPEGTQQTHLAARQVYEFLGAGQKIGLYYRPGKHEHNEQDFLVLLDFADRQFFGKSVQRKFDELAFPNSAKHFSWTAPGGK